jgi:flagellar biosynthesis protein FliQ
MSQDLVLKLTKETLQLTLMVSGPMLIVALVVGVIVSVVQVVTSIQDMTLSHVPKIIAVFVTFLFAFPWMMNMLLSFTSRLYGHLDNFVR